MPQTEGVLSRLIRDFVEAARKHERKLAKEILAEFCDKMHSMAEPPTEQDAIGLMKRLRSSRMFDDLAAVGDLLMSMGATSPLIRRYTAQGHIDAGRIEAGAAMARQLAADLEAQVDALSVPAERESGHAVPDDLIDERANTLALVGRAYKDLFVRFEKACHRGPRREESLRRAIDFYLRAFEVARPVEKDFPGSNVMALLKIAEREGIRIDGAPAITTMADEVQKAAELEPKRHHKDPWAAASIAEAHLARGNLKEAADWYGIYAYHPQVDAFMLGGTIRQLEEIWGLKAGTKDSEQILTALKARLLNLEGGSVELSMEERRALIRADASDFGEYSQRVLAGQQHYQPSDGAAETVPAPALSHEKTLTKTSAHVEFRTMLTAVRRGEAVARIGAGQGMTVGTGFLVRGSDLCPMLGPELLILTNAHVVSKAGSSDPGDPPVAPQIARISFDIDTIEGREASYKCEIVWESPIDELDAVLLRPLPGSIAHPPLAIAPPDVELVPEQGAASPAPVTRLLIIGHPFGGTLKISLEMQQKSTLLDIGTKPPGEHIFLHYRTPTEPGMSGSPVLDEQTGALVGLHHAGPSDISPEIPRLNGQNGGIRANEGVLIHSIGRAMAKSLGGAVAASVAPRAPAASRSTPAPAARAQAEATRTPARPISYQSLIAKLADPAVDNSQLAQYFVPLPDASGPYAPAFGINPALVDTGADTGSTGPGALAGLMNDYCALDRRVRCRTRLRTGGETLRFVSEGDSWFEYPLLVDDVIDHLEKAYPVFCLAASADTIDNMLSDENFRTSIAPAIAEVRPHGLLLSAGGSEIFGPALKTFIARHDPKLQPHQYLTPAFLQHLRTLQSKLAHAYGRLHALAAKMKIFAHGYDLAPPRGDGKWIAATFDALDIKDPALRRQIMGHILGAIAGVHHALERGHPDRVYFVDVRGVVPPGMWLDELHPTSEGFAKVAERYQQRIGEAFAGSGGGHA